MVAVNIKSVVDPDLYAHLSTKSSTPSRERREAPEHDIFWESDFDASEPLVVAMHDGMWSW